MYEIIKIKDGVIESHSIVNRNLRENEIIVNNWSGTIGEPLTFYDENYKRYTDIELINKGLKEIPKGMKRVKKAAFYMIHLPKGLINWSRFRIFLRKSEGVSLVWMR